jgi:hypothetical protein
MDKSPKLGTRRRTVFDMLIATPGEWIDFNPTELGYSSAHCGAIRSDLLDFRDVYNLDIRTAGAGRPGLCRWRYVPR